uniref:Uncharacterized protein n=1 Tax=Denticeps clupeoides TaxID=299321 RepID=A0AAY4ACJ7_9TELE
MVHRIPQNVLVSITAKVGVSKLTFEPMSRLFALIFSCCILRNLVRLVHNKTHPGLQLLDLLLATFHGNLLSFIQTVLQVLDGLLHVLLHALQMGTGVLFLLHLIPAASLRLQGALQGIHYPLLVPLGLLHLFIFLNQLTLNVSLHLVKLQLSP